MPVIVNSGGLFGGPSFPSDGPPVGRLVENYGADGFDPVEMERQTWAAHAAYRAKILAAARTPLGPPPGSGIPAADPPPPVPTLHGTLVVFGAGSVPPRAGLSRLYGEEYRHTVLATGALPRAELDTVPVVVEAGGSETPVGAQPGRLELALSPARVTFALLAGHPTARAVAAAVAGGELWSASPVLHTFTAAAGVVTLAKIRGVRLHRGPGLFPLSAVRVVPAGR